MIPGEKKFKTSVISKQVNSSRLSFAEPEYMTEFLDITPGSVSVLGLMNDSSNRVQLLIDEDILKDEYFGCHPCINTSSLKIRMDDLLHIFLPHVKHDVIYVTL
jgi:Ala-tRNA(Pro) deacylase